MTEKLENARIVPLSQLMGENIGEEAKAKEKEESNADLELAIEGKETPNDFFNLDTSKKKAEEEELKNTTEETAEVESIDKSEVFKNTEKDYNIVKSDQSEVYRKTLKSMFGNSISSLIQEDEEGNETEVSLDDLEIDEDLFKEIVESKLDMIKEEASKDKISVQGVSDFARRLVEIDRNGGDISELIKMKESYSDPLDRIDLTTEQGQQQAVFLRLTAGGQDADTAMRLIKSYQDEGSLEDMAVKSEKELREALNVQLEQARLNSEKRIEQRKELLKNYKKDLRNNLDQFKLNDSVKNKIVTIATKEDDYGRFELDRLYYSFREDPSKAARLALFLLDEEEFVKQVTNDAVQNTKLNSAKKLKVVLGSSKSTAGPQLKSNTSKEDNLLPLDRLSRT